VFSLAYRDTVKLCNVYTVGSNTELITSQKVLRITPQYSLKDCPMPDILVLPGGDTRVIKKNEQLIQWLTKNIDNIDIALSVCTGASILGEAGLLDNQKATTHKFAIRRMQENYPKASFLANTRFVDNGRVITTAGISAGIDGALHVVQRLFGKDVAHDIVDWMEYDGWIPDK
jgi:transcriptional regulator GlxA family with amidase domain